MLRRLLLLIPVSLLAGAPAARPSSQLPPARGGDRGAVVASAASARRPVPPRIGVARAPAASPSALSGTMGVRETILPNGLKVLTKESHTAPVVSFQMWYKVGSRNEHTGLTGVSHLLEH